jgi:hypothetical protein
MRSTPALLTIALLSLGLVGCGSTRATGVPASGTSTGHYLNDGDNDVIGDADSDNNHDNDKDNSEDHKPNDNGNYHDSDDSIVTFGHAANSVDMQAIAAAVKRYYAVAASDNGSKACSMLIPSLARAIPEDDGPGSAGPSYLQAGRTCPAIMALLFKNMRNQVTASIHVTAVRTNGNHAVALLGSKTAPASEILIERQDGAWMISSLTGSPLP